MRPRHRFIIKEMFDDARCRFPPDMLDLARLRSPLIISIGLGCVVVMAGLGFPRTDGLRVKRPVRNVNAADAVDQRAAFQLSRCQPLARVPTADLLADLTLADLERQQALRPNRGLDFLIVNQRWRSTELAVLSD